MTFQEEENKQKRAFQLGHIRLLVTNQFREEVWQTIQYQLKLPCKIGLK